MHQLRFFCAEIEPHGLLPFFWAKIAVQRLPASQIGYRVEALSSLALNSSFFQAKIAVQTFLLVEIFQRQEKKSIIDTS
jgi:hypothetical protein